MAAIPRPKLLGRCPDNCGEILIQHEGEEPIWTRNQAIIALFKDSKAKKMSCPGHGGDASVRMAGGFHPLFHQHLRLA